MASEEAGNLWMVFVIPFCALLVALGDVVLLPSALSIAWHFQWHTPIATPCEVIQRDVVRVGGKGAHTVWRVTFRYGMNGTTYTAADETSRRFYQEHPEGSETQCYVSPVAHGKALLGEHFSELGPEWWQVPLVLLPFNVLAIVAIIWWPSVARAEYRRLNYRDTPGSL